MRSDGEYMRDQQQRKELLLVNYKRNEPKLEFSFDGCYNYDQLKKEGYINQ